MSEIIKTTVLYNREKNGVEVEAKQDVVNVPVEGKEGEFTEKKVYTVTGSFEGEVVQEQEGTGYRQTIADGRAMFKEVYHEHVGQHEEAKKAQEAAEKAQAAAEKAEAAELAEAAEPAEEVAEDAAVEDAFV